MVREESFTSGSLSRGKLEQVMITISQYIYIKIDVTSSRPDAFTVVLAILMATVLIYFVRFSFCNSWKYRFKTSVSDYKQDYELDKTRIILYNEKLSILKH